MFFFFAFVTNLLPRTEIVLGQEFSGRQFYVAVNENDHLFSKSDFVVEENVTSDELACLHLCLSVENCWSVNYGPRYPSSSKCQLLSWSNIAYQQFLTERKGYVFIKLETPCDIDPCQNGGLCIPTKTEEQFRCECPKHYGGKVCDKYCVIFDFEHDKLSGWWKTGTAFDTQPTYGDNPAARGRGEPANQSGFWWIGTFENRSSASSPVATQGDGPTGTLLSTQFTIRGDRLSFLIGGGCDIKTSRAELWVSGVVVASSTGECKETMREEVWNVTAWKGQTAQLKLIDSASSGWDHINFDHLLDEAC